ncbi:MAG TPA: hypothetical protein VK625_12515 [Flavitalea sp.]|nr:hypothetical protein [Flavitalea sp.]
MNKGSHIFKEFRLIHLAIILGLVIFCIVSIVMVQLRLKSPVGLSVDRILQVVVIIFSVALLFAGFRYFKNTIMKIRGFKHDAEKRIADYRSACIIWWAMIDAPALLALVCFLITGNYAFFAVAFCHLIVLIFFMPKRENIILLLNLSSQELQRLEM